MDGWDNSIELYAALEDLGEMTLRIYVPYDIEPDTPLEQIAEAVAAASSALPAAMCAPVASRSSWTACWNPTPRSWSTTTRTTRQSWRARSTPPNTSTRSQRKPTAWACRLSSTRAATVRCGARLDGYAHALAVNGRRDSRHRVEHIEVIHPDDIPRFAELGVIASMQPAHCPPTLHEGDVWPSRAGAARWPFSFAWETLRQAGAHLAYGSDWPVVPTDPMLGFYCGLVREQWAEGDPDQRQTLENLIAGYTRDAAYAEFQEHEKGMIRPGMLADLVLLSEDIFAVPPEEITRVHPVLTMCDGRTVFRSI